jgi:hypothetical protein
VKKVALSLGDCGSPSWLRTSRAAAERLVASVVGRESGSSAPALQKRYFVGVDRVQTVDYDARQYTPAFVDLRLIPCPAAGF